MKRLDYVDIAMETIEIIKQGFYEQNGEKHPLGLTYDEMHAVRVFAPKELASIKATLSDADLLPGCCEYCVVNMDSYEAARKYGQDGSTLVLNFANPRFIGGGFISGAPAQEESLCRCSTLYASISSKPAREMYEYNREHPNIFDSDYLLISPKVAVFRDANCRFLPQPFVTAVITAAAPDKKHRAFAAPQTEIDENMLRKTRNILAAAAKMTYDTLVLGAWGCGAFGHDAARVADYFKQVLAADGYAGLFRKIVFAVYAKNTDDYNYTSFVKAFGVQGQWRSAHIVADENKECVIPKNVNTSL